LTWEWRKYNVSTADAFWFYLYSVKDPKRYFHNLGIFLAKKQPIGPYFAMVI